MRISVILLSALVVSLAYVLYSFLLPLLKVPGTGELKSRPFLLYQGYRLLPDGVELLFSVVGEGNELYVIVDVNGFLRRLPCVMEGSQACHVDVPVREGRIRLGYPVYREVYVKRGGELALSEILLAENHEVNVYEEVRCKVCNVGSESTTGRLVLLLDGGEKNGIDVTLGGSSCAELSLGWTPDVNGVHALNISVDGSSYEENIFINPSGTYHTVLPGLAPKALETYSTALPGLSPKPLETYSTVLPSLWDCPDELNSCFHT